ncbi:MAG: amidohydrolase, partial [Gemmatimonadota bacterium]|nr:amidohydrolase [Gemmatimonadota bacterium]
MKILPMVLLLTSVATATVWAQRPKLSPGTRQFVTVDEAVVALTHVRVIDGTGAAAMQDQTVVISDGVIRSIAPSASAVVPEGAKTIDLSGASVIPGLVMVHEHLFYPTGGLPLYSEQAFSFPRMYLAGGVTTMRTGGSMEPYTDINVRRMIDAGSMPGPKIDVTGPYLERSDALFQVHSLTGPEDARQMV